MRKHSTGFYLEALLLIVVFVGMILVLTRVFGLGKAESRGAAVRTEAVLLAQNACEVVAAADTPEEAASLLEAIVTGDEKDARIAAAFARDSGHYTMQVDWVQDDAGLVEAEVRVYLEDPDSVLSGDGPGELVYTLKTAAYHTVKEVQP